MVELDGTCGTCNTRGKGTYLAGANCSNCKAPAFLILSKGHNTPRWNEGPECPVCGTKTWESFEVVAAPKAGEHA